MVFNSYEFIVVFLPIAFAAVALAHGIGGWNAAFTVLGLASLAFYANWGLEFLGILLVSIVSNYVIGSIITRSRENKIHSRSLLAFGVLGNLAALGYFKYTNFFIDVVNQTTGAGFSHLSIILPIGISFYTFIQIGYLIDAYSGLVKQKSFAKYFTFASLFPCVTAGPLVFQREIFQQMEDRKDAFLDLGRIAAGLTLFTIGLFKKVVFADSIASYSDTVFNGVAGGQGLDALTAWVGALSYTFQLYFDFSGYTDMALGLGAIFGILLPLNFNSPFKATSISDFWQRWHMTMTRFFTNYVYSPMAMTGMRTAIAGQFGPARKFIASGAWPIVFTMLVAGIWHGSGWVFVVYGLIHGLAIAVNNAWRYFNMPKLAPITGWFLTMLVVVCGLVVFRAPDVPTAVTILTVMFGGQEFILPQGIEVIQLAVAEVAPMIVLFGAIVLLMPNSQEIVSSTWISTSDKPDSIGKFAEKMLWLPQARWGLAVTGVFVVSFSMIGSDSSFLYYQF
ncbi:MAG: MBOAT family O-acyltransferase [Anderseniella sp.]